MDQKYAIICDYSASTTYYLAKIAEATEVEIKEAANHSYPPYINDNGTCWKCFETINLDDLHRVVWCDMRATLGIDDKEPDGWDWNRHPFWIVDKSQYDYIAVLNVKKPIKKELREATVEYQRLKALYENGKLITRAEKERKIKEYNVIFNEGAEGYNPYCYAATHESYLYWKNRHESLTNKLKALC